MGAKRRNERIMLWGCLGVLPKPSKRKIEVPWMSSLEWNSSWWWDREACGVSGSVSVEDREKIIDMNI